MKALRNGWCWFAALAAFCLLKWPADVSGELRACESVQLATEAQRDGLMLQSVVLAKEVERQHGEIVKANQWAAGMRKVVGQLELQCRAVRP